MHKRDVIKAGVMVDKAPDLALILAFDVKVSPDAAALAKASGVTIFTADIIYHLFDQFSRHMELSRERARKALADKGVAVFPAVLKISKGDIFNKVRAVRESPHAPCLRARCARTPVVSKRRSLTQPLPNPPFVSATRSSSGARSSMASSASARRSASPRSSSSKSVPPLLTLSRRHYGDSIEMEKRV